MKVASVTFGLKQKKLSAICYERRFSLLCRWSMWPMSLVLGVCSYQYGPSVMVLACPFMCIFKTSLFVLFRWPGLDHCQRSPGGSAGRGLWMSGRCLPLVLPSQKPSKCTYLLSILWLHSGHHFSDPRGLFIYMYIVFTCTGELLRSFFRIRKVSYYIIQFDWTLRFIIVHQIEPMYLCNIIRN